MIYVSLCGFDLLCIFLVANDVEHLLICFFLSFVFFAWRNIHLDTLRPVYIYAIFVEEYLGKWLHSFFFFVEISNEFHILPINLINNLINPASLIFDLINLTLWATQERKSSYYCAFHDACRHSFHTLFRSLLLCYPLRGLSWSSWLERYSSLMSLFSLPCFIFYSRTCHALIRPSFTALSPPVWCQLSEGRDPV